MSLKKTDREKAFDLDEEYQAKINRFEMHLPVANQVRIENLCIMTRGLEIPANQTATAKNSFYKARHKFVKNAIAYNYTDTEICLALHISGKLLSDIKTKIFKEEIVTLERMTQKEHFVEYKMKQTEIVKDLDTLIELHRKSKNLQGLAQALKSKKEILEEIKKSAQECGFMDKKADEVKIIDGTNIKDLSNQDLIERIHSNNVLLQQLLEHQASDITMTEKRIKVKLLLKKETLQ